MDKEKIPDEQEDGFISALKEVFRHGKKIWPIIGAIVVIFGGGFWAGSFYSNLMNKFEISELKALHQKELQDQKFETLSNQLKEKDQVKEKLDSSIIPEKGENDEK